MRILVSVLLLSFLSPNLWAKLPLHFPALGASPEEYESFAKKHPVMKSKQNLPESPYVAASVALGGRNLAWLTHINSLRAPDDQILFTRLGELPAYPIDKPTVYSPKTIEAEYLLIEKEIPLELKTVLFEDAPFTDTPPVAMDVYQKWGLRIVRLYESATRWEIMVQYMDMMIEGKHLDIRGYYYLPKEKGLEAKLENWASQSRRDKIRWKPLLVNLCENSMKSTVICKKEFEKSRRQKSLLAFYQRYLPDGKKVYDSNFLIADKDARKDLRFTSPDTLYVPFQPSEPDINEFLVTNIEEEWRWGDWNLRLDFQKSAEIRVEFQSGVIPHVPPEDVNLIVMDRNPPRTEWNTQYTIRHEFGHILGFPDCYVEFYDEEKEEVMAYQLDTTNIMCSRAGRMQESLYQELKRVYFRP